MINCWFVCFMRGTQESHLACENSFSVRQYFLAYTSPVTNKSEILFTHGVSGKESVSQYRIIHPRWPWHWIQRSGLRLPAGSSFDIISIRGGTNLLRVVGGRSRSLCSLCEDPSFSACSDFRDCWRGEMECPNGGLSSDDEGRSGLMHSGRFSRDNWRRVNPALGDVKL